MDRHTDVLSCHSERQYVRYTEKADITRHKKKINIKNKQKENNAILCQTLPGEAGKKEDKHTKNSLLNGARTKMGEKKTKKNKGQL